jgi:aspartyl-tRNA(Asn)/glutamyl-tRNA(Gln) amidotransferase subunit C
MPHLSIEEVHRIAGLAKLRLTDDEATRVHGDLEAILKHVDALQEADVEGIEPMSSPLEHVNRLRPDTPATPLAAETVLGLAPDTAEAFVLVPRVLEGGAGA